MQTIDHDKLTRRFCVGCTQYNENILQPDDNDNDFHNQ